MQSDNYLKHFGIKGQKWGVRRYQNKDGTLTTEGKERYDNKNGKLTEKGIKQFSKDYERYSKAVENNRKVKKVIREELKSNKNLRDRIFEQQLDVKLQYANFKNGTINQYNRSQAAKEVRIKSAKEYDKLAELVTRKVRDLPDIDFPKSPNVHSLDTSIRYVAIREWDKKYRKGYEKALKQEYSKK